MSWSRRRQPHRDDAAAGGEMLLTGKRSACVAGHRVRSGQNQDEWMRVVGMILEKERVGRAMMLLSLHI